MQILDANVQYRNSVFCSYFQDTSRLLSLCNAILNTDYKDSSELEITTLEGTFFSKIKNDISCKIGDHFLVLVEHQSSINENMPFRCLSYVSEVLNNLIKDKHKLYHQSLIRFPAPRFVVLYDGNDDEPLQREMRLSNAFGGDSSSLELIVSSYNINHGKDQLLMEKCQPLREYSIFVGKVKEGLSNGLSLDESIITAVNFCLENHIMFDYLQAHGKEVFSMTRLEWNEEAARKAWQEEGMEKGINKGENNAIIAIKMLKDNKSPDLIHQQTGISLNKINELKLILQ